MERKPKLLERIAGLIPGYKGYADRAQRRDADQALRTAVVATLDSSRKAIDRIIMDCSRSMQFEHLEPLEAQKRRLAVLADTIRHAPAGYSGFFDRVQIGAEELAAIHDRDLVLGEAVEDLSARLVTSGKDARSACEMLDGVLPALEESLRHRDRLIQGA